MTFKFNPPFEEFCVPCKLAFDVRLSNREFVTPYFPKIHSYKKIGVCSFYSPLLRWLDLQVLSYNPKEAHTKYFLYHLVIRIVNAHRRALDQNGTHSCVIHPPVLKKLETCLLVVHPVICVLHKIAAILLNSCQSWQFRRTADVGWQGGWSCLSIDDKS